MDVTQFIASYWWLVFPFGFMVIGVVQTVTRGDIERKRLDVIKSYVDKGLDVPDALKRQTF
jgi:hypothetical protein